MLEYRTRGFNGYSIQYSPFFDSRLAVASAANFGLVGNGRLYILNLTPNGIVAEKWFDTQDSLFDLAWSESHENQVLAATGDGSLKLFDIGLENSNPTPEGPRQDGGFPIASWQEHKREVFSAHWNLMSKDTFCSSSWDGTVKVWSPNRPTSLLTIPTHSCTYSALYSPHSPSILSAVSSDSHLRIFDLRTPASASNHLVMRIPIHSAPAAKASFSSAAATPPSEALTHDWNRYSSSLVATGSVDRLIRTFDTRAPNQGPLAVLAGHEYAVRRLAWSPHLGDVLLSAGYDMTARIWRTSAGIEAGAAVGPGGAPQGPGAIGGPGGEEIGRMNQHSEFVTGVDWCLFGAEGWCASVGWDERVLVWDVRAFMGR
ncbi:MAG: hypothetical protein M4579_000815 [Chaenotheca gracillima]|nr:MAG: hypothetical protein M4579_000815 [Chaenotheca gracillima]